MLRNHTLSNGAEPTVIVFRECVSVDNIKLSQPEEFIARENVLPLAFENLHACLLVPTLFFNLSKYIGVRLNNGMESRRFGKGLKDSVDLGKRQKWPGNGKARYERYPDQNQY